MVRSLPRILSARHSPVVRKGGRRVARVSRGAPELVAAGYVRTGWSVSIALGLVAGHALGLTPLAIVAAGLVFAATALSYAEGVSMFPESGGASAFTRHAFNDLASFVSAWAMSLAFAVVIAISALFAVHYLSVFWAPLAHSPWDLVGGVGVIAAVALLNIRGVRSPPGLEVFLGIVGFGLEVLLVVLGAILIFRPHQLAQGFHLTAAPSARQLLLGVVLATMAYTGIETITGMAGEARNPDRDLGRAVRGLLAGVLVLFFALSVVALMAMPVTSTAGGSRQTLLAGSPGHGYAAYPLLGIVARLPLHVLSTGALHLVGLLVAVVLVAVANAGVLGFTRLSYSLSQHYQLPAAAARLHPRYQTPYVAVAACTAVAAGLLMSSALVADPAAYLAGLYAFGAMIVFTILQLAIIVMRWRDPVRHRASKVPFGIRVRGRELPLTALAGGLATLLVWIAVIVLQRDPRWVGGLWMTAGLAAYAGYRRRAGIGLTERRRREIAHHIGPGIEVEFRTMLIPVSTDLPDIPSDVVADAACLAAERRSLIVLLAFTEIPLSEELDMEIDGLEQTVQRFAAQAEAIGERYGIRIHTTHLRTRDPAESILAEAGRRSSELILLGAEGLHRTTFRRIADDHVVRRIAAEAQQRVMIVSSPPVTA